MFSGVATSRDSNRYTMLLPRGCLAMPCHALPCDREKKKQKKTVPLLSTIAQAAIGTFYSVVAHERRPNLYDIYRRFTASSLPADANPINIYISIIYSRGSSQGGLNPATHVLEREHAQPHRLGPKATVSDATVEGIIVQHPNAACKTRTSNRRTPLKVITPH